MSAATVAEHFEVSRQFSEEMVSWLEAPKAKNKWLTASSAEDAREIVGRLFDEAERRDPGHKRRVALVDGNNHQIDHIGVVAMSRIAEIPQSRSPKFRGCPGGGERWMSVGQLRTITSPPTCASPGTGRRPPPAPSPASRRAGELLGLVHEHRAQPGAGSHGPEPFRP
ncbi:MAG: hypothetical protein ACYDES_13000 [Acidimicrobiales bacterium]